MDVVVVIEQMLKGDRAAANEFYNLLKPGFIKHMKYRFSDLSDQEVEYWYHESLIALKSALELGKVDDWTKCQTYLNTIGQNKYLNYLSRNKVLVNVWGTVNLENIREEGSEFSGMDKKRFHDEKELMDKIVKEEVAKLEEKDQLLLIGRAEDEDHKDIYLRINPNEKDTSTEVLGKKVSIQRSYFERLRKRLIKRILTRFQKESQNL